MDQSSPGLPDQPTQFHSHIHCQHHRLCFQSFLPGNGITTILTDPDTPTPSSSPGKKKARALRITSVPPTSNRVDPIQFETTYVPASTTHSTTPSDIFSDHMELAIADLPELSRWDDGSSACDDDESSDDDQEISTVPEVVLLPRFEGIHGTQRKTDVVLGTGNRG